jgi:hypothetical protein
LKLKLKQSWVKSIPLIQISILIIFKSVNLLPYSNAYCYADYCWVIQDLTFYGCLLLTKRLEWLLVSLWSYNAYYIPFINQNVHQQQSCPHTLINSLCTMTHLCPYTSSTFPYYSSPSLFFFIIYKINNINLKFLYT